MSAPSSNPSESILRFEGVRLNPGLEPKAKTFDFELRAGEIALFCSDSKSKPPEIANLAMGIHRPAEGSISFRQQNWAEIEAPEMLHLRCQIGRVFAPRGVASWVQNLDVDENVMVAQFFRPGQTSLDVLERTNRLAGRFGFKHLPQGRPSTTSAEELTRAQWVRAFLPVPLRLLILERPGFRLSSSELQPLIRQINEVRNEGTAVLWIDFQGEFQEHEELQIDHRFEKLPKALDGAS